MAKKKSVRTTVSLDEAQISQMSAIAEGNDVSLAWVIRQAVTFYLADQNNKKTAAGRKKKP